MNKKLRELAKKWRDSAMRSRIASSKVNHEWYDAGRVYTKSEFHDWGLPEEPDAQV
jgi:hypothetical protein